MKLSKFDSQMIKGIAILIMVFHHLFGENSWLLSDVHHFSIMVNTTSIEQSVAIWGKICISIYTFLSGYGLYITFEKNEQKAKDVIYRLLKIFLNGGLIVVLVFLPLSIWVTDSFAVDVFIKNLFLFDVSWCPFADYLIFYILVVLTYPLIHKVLKKINRPWITLIIAPFGGMILRKVLAMIIDEGGMFEIFNFYLLYLPFLLAGCCVKQGELYEKLYGLLPRNTHWTKVICAFVICLSIPCRLLIFKNRLMFDSYLATAFIFCSAILLNGKEESIVGKGLFFLGKHSTNIWFIHAVFFFTFAEYTQKILYWPYVPVLITLWCIILCLPMSCVVNWILSMVNKNILVSK